jgi:hypothetical protein
MSSELDGVSCISTSACFAVGYYLNSRVGYGGTLAEAWNGTSWSIQHTPNHSGLLKTLAGVSCTAANACTAVGLGSNGLLAEHWNGTRWAIQSTPLPSGALGGSLGSVSCTSAKVCEAVGYFATTAGAAVTLAEHHSG